MRDSRTRRSRAVLAIILSAMIAWPTCLGGLTYAFAEGETAGTTETQAEGTNPPSDGSLDEDGAPEGSAEGSSGQTSGSNEQTSEDTSEESAVRPGPMRAPRASTSARPAAVAVRTHVQDIGWMGEVADGGLAGTTGQAKRVEGFYFWLKMSDGGYDTNAIIAKAHVQDYGWMPEVSNGDLVGTTGEAKRVEAIRLTLAQKYVDQGYHIYYRVHVQDYGWTSWAKDGEAAGTMGYALRLEAVQVQVVKGDAKPSNGKVPGPAVSWAFKSDLAVQYDAHVQDIGWQGWVANGEMAGTSGRGLRVEALQMKVSGTPYAGGISYQAHVENIGWQNWVTDGAMAGTSGRSLRVEAIKVQLTGELATYYDVYYRVHIQDVGWLGWAKDGEVAGSTGYAKRVEAVQVQLVPKGAAAPGATDRHDASDYLKELYSTMSGIDIASPYQNGIDIAATGSDFVIVKATQGTHYTNKKMTEWADEVLAQGRCLGLYHFVEAQSDPVKQADYFVKAVGPYIGRAVLFLDWENIYVNGQCTSDARSKGVSWAKQFLDEVYKQTGARPLIYTSKSVTTAYNWSSVANAGYRLWGAQYLYKYYDNPVYGFVKDPTLSTKWGVWGTPTVYQYTSRGRLSGFSGDLDLDYFYGSRSDWNALCARS